MNPLTEVDSRLWAVAYDIEGFERALGEWSPSHPLGFQDRITIGASIRKEYFEPASDEGLNVFDPREEVLCPAGGHSFDLDGV